MSTLPAPFIAIAVGLFMNGTSVSAQVAPVESRVEISAGFQQTFTVSGKRNLTLGKPRRSRIGPDNTGPGQITIGLAPAGGAVGVAKLHVFERTTVPVGFTATAFKGPDAIATVEVRGCLDMDSWVGLSAETTSVRLFAFVPIKDSCK
jgi:hypothetical protein